MADLLRHSFETYMVHCPSSSPLSVVRREQLLIFSFPTEQRAFRRSDSGLNSPWKWRTWGNWPYFDEAGDSRAFNPRVSTVCVGFWQQAQDSFPQWLALPQSRGSCWCDGGLSSLETLRDLKVFFWGVGWEVSVYCGRFLLNILNVLFFRSLRSLRTIIY